MDGGIDERGRTLPVSQSESQSRRKLGCVWWLIIGTVGGVGALFAALFAVALIAVSLEDDQETSAGTAPSTPTTASVDSQIAAAIEIQPAGSSLRYDDDSREWELSMYWQYTNRSPKDITAWQFRADASMVDALGRTFTKTLLVDCTSPPLAVGASRGPRSTTDDSIRLQVEDQEQCTLTPRDLNSYDAQEAGLIQAIREGGSFSIAIRRTVVIFADGSRIGNAL
jgi:hypothetical protein